MPDDSRADRPEPPGPGLPVTRRRLLGAAVLGGLAAAVELPLSRAASAQGSPPKGPSRVALTTGDSRADNVLRALKEFGRETARAIGNRRVVIKPNNVAIDHQPAATHAETLEGILEFLKSIGKLGNTVIAESAANGSTIEGFNNYGYPAVARKYGVKLLDLDQEASQTLHVLSERDLRPHPVRMSRVLVDPDTFIISAALMKTHDRVVTTLSLKNIVLGAPIKDLGSAWVRGRRGARNDKPIVHGDGVRGTNYNLFALAQRLAPHLALIDGYEGMEGNGPVGGQTVAHRVCVASPDWLAADRVAVELMGIDFAKVGYLTYCADAGLGEGDLKKIEVLGEPIARHARTYRLADNVEDQLSWMTPPRRS